jgi:protein transport protein SEC61 subunit beta
MSTKEVAQNAIRKRQVGSVAKPEGKGNQEDLKFFTQDSTGLQLHPKTVLLVSIIYMGVVVLLHIFGKLRQSEPETL